MAESHNGASVQFPDNWPRDPKSPHRFLCAPGHPMPMGASGQWSHTNLQDVGGCSEGCCDDYRCKDCGHQFRVEAPD